jgi:hypothetical protein
MTLPNDVCRCASKTCPKMFDCARHQNLPKDLSVSTFYPFSDFTPQKSEVCGMFITTLKGQ